MTTGLCCGWREQVSIRTLGILRSTDSCLFAVRVGVGSGRHAHPYGLRVGVCLPCLTVMHHHIAVGLPTPLVFFWLAVVGFLVSHLAAFVHPMLLLLLLLLWLVLFVVKTAAQLGTRATLVICVIIHISVGVCGGVSVYQPKGCVCTFKRGAGTHTHRQGTAGHLCVRVRVRVIVSSDSSNCPGRAVLKSVCGLSVCLSFCLSVRLCWCFWSPLCVLEQHRI